MHRIAVLDDYAGSVATLPCWDRLAGLATIDVLTSRLTDDEVGARLRGYQILIAIRERTRFTASLLERLPDLELLALTGRNIGQVDVQAATDRGVLVTETDGSGASTFELTIALILAMVRHLPAEDRNVREGGWQEQLGYELEGKTLGIVGLGRIGTRVAEFGELVGMEVIAAERSDKRDDRPATGGRLRRVPLAELFQTADVISLNLRLVAATRAIVTRELLSSMKPTAFIVNTARSGLVDQDALFDVLYDRRIAGAAIDVFDDEPLALDDRWRSLDNIVLSPHMGYVTHEAFELFFGQAVQQIEEYLRGAAPSRLLNPDVRRSAGPPLAGSSVCT